MSNILKKANEIINNRSEEKERQYGPMGEGFERAAMIASGMSGKAWTAHDMFIAMVALKFSRQSYNFKEDNLLDAVAYLGAWQNYINETSEEDDEEEQKHERKNIQNDFLSAVGNHTHEDLKEGKVLEKKVPSNPYALKEALVEQTKNVSYTMLVPPSHYEDSE
tara:strand:- start:2088 stop:2579 length:492 start_codon:yes stop_codon:yes gene_type:complete